MIRDAESEGRRTAICGASHITRFCDLYIHRRRGACAMMRQTHVAAEELSQTGAELLFEVFSQRHELGAPS
jgi:hypothetical protein